MLWNRSKAAEDSLTGLLELSSPLSFEERIYQSVMAVFIGALCTAMLCTRVRLGKVGRSYSHVEVKFAAR
jgi:hypothetical protein